MRGRRARGNDEEPLMDRNDEVLSNEHEIGHLTRLRSEPCVGMRKGFNSNRKLPIATIDMLHGREANWSGRGRFSLADRAYIFGRHLPVNGPWHVDRMDSRAYVSQFSADGSFLVAGFQGSRIRIYDVDREWRLHKDIIARSLRWTITDTALSPDQRFLVYASICPVLHIVNVGSVGSESYANVTDIHEGLVLSYDDDDDYSIGIFCVKFSNDGRELVAGSNDEAIYVYDLEANKVTIRIPAHSCDVNTVAFADDSGHVLYSGSDDTLCKIWDRRCFMSRIKPVGVLTGHLEGITFIDSRSDGRYLISNSKDQTIKLWDIRKMTDHPKSSRTKSFHWDYRWMEYPSEARHRKHTSDLSLATYRGHSVLQSLIRCYFSPTFSTGQRYIYTGSNDKCVYIYDVLSGARVAKLAYHGSTVRDCSWHPHLPMLVSSSWDCLVARWEFSGGGEAGMAAPAKRKRRRLLPGGGAQ